MYCGNCGTRLPEWAHFCEKCGAKVHAALGADPIEHLEVEDSMVEPLWDENPEQGEAVPETKDRRPADGATVAMVVAEELDPKNVTTPIDTADLIDDVANDAHEKETALDDGEAGEGTEDDANHGSEENLLDQTQPIDESDLIATDSEDVEDAAEAADDAMPDDQAADEDSSSQEQEESDAQEDDSADESAESPSEAQDSVPPFLSEAQASSVQMVEEGVWDDIETVEGRYVLNPWEGRRRASERQRSRVPMALVAGVVCGAMLIILSIAYNIIFGRMADDVQQGDAPAVSSKAVTADEASRVITSLDGWWKTNRTYDGRYWHLQDGLMEVYAADGKIASQVLLDAKSIEHMSAGPGGIESAGYYLRDIAFYLTDDDPDTLYAIDIDGTADEDANLRRSDAPPFMSGDEQAGVATSSQPQETIDESEYVLPESSTRVYEAWELEGLSDHDLFIARNEIYARHGYVFEGGELSEYFASKSWYLASDVFNEADITEIERQNVSLILSIEQQRGSSYM